MIAAELGGRTVAEWRNRMTTVELAHWAAFFKVRKEETDLAIAEARKKAEAGR